MNRDKSRSRLSSVGSKAKIRQTISDAMGRSHEQVSNCNGPRRSESTKSLRSFNGSMINNNPPYGYSASSRKNSQHQLLNSKLQMLQKSFVHATIKSWQWWHIQNAKLITQEKVRQSGPQKQILKYFAFQSPKNSKKKILFATQNNQIFPGYPQLRILMIDTNNNKAQLMPKNHSIKIPPNKQPYILIYQQKQSKQAKKTIKHIINEEICVKKKKIDGILNDIIKKTIQGAIQSQFFLLLSFTLSQETRKSKKVQALGQIVKSEKMRKKLF